MHMHHNYGIMGINVLKVLCGMEKSNENSLDVTQSDSLQFIAYFYQLFTMKYNINS